MNPRALVLCTLLSLISFLSLVKMAAGQANSGDPPASAMPQPDIATLKKMAEGGDVQAQFLLGLDYMTGNGVAQDFKEAVRWYLAASAKARLTPSSAWAICMNRERVFPRLHPGDGQLHGCGPAGTCNRGEQPGLHVRIRTRCCQE